jgi:hypothetical protein
MNDPVGCREMELLCRQRATFDIQHSWKWLGEAERWKDLAHREAASRFHAGAFGSNGYGSEYETRRPSCNAARLSS